MAGKKPMRRYNKNAPVFDPKKCYCGNEGKLNAFGEVLCDFHNKQLADGMESVMTEREICRNCSGSGWYPVLFENRTTTCYDCKGTGWIYNIII